MKYLFGTAVSALIAIVAWTKGPGILGQPLAFYLACAGVFAGLFFFRKGRTRRLPNDPLMWLVVGVPSITGYVGLRQFALSDTRVLILGIVALLLCCIIASFLQHRKIIS
jgi:hypothetical protein